MVFKLAIHNVPNVKVALANTLRELEALVASEIKFSITHHADAGFAIQVRDYVRGAEIEAAVKTFDEAVAWLREQAKARYPQSSYARKLLTN